MELFTKLTLEKETKGTFRYSEDEGEGLISIVRTLYIQKEAIPGPPPEHIKITIQSEE